MQEARSRQASRRIACINLTESERQVTRIMQRNYEPISTAQSRYYIRLIVRDTRHGVYPPNAFFLIPTTNNSKEILLKHVIK